MNSAVVDEQVAVYELLNEAIKITRRSVRRGHHDLHSGNSGPLFKMRSRPTQRSVMRRCKGTEINADNDSAIVPFAQSEMVTTFMEGVDPSYQGTVADAVATALTSVANELLDALKGGQADDVPDSVTETIVSGVLNELHTNLKGERWKHFVSPVLSVVAALPKAELASMAESLVNLTSMKRHVSSVSETVGGPIDVALISKGDGFV